MARIVPVTSAAHAELWANLWQADPLQNPLYSPLNVLYSKEYAHDCQFEDLSFVIEEGGQPLMGVQMSLETRSDGTQAMTAFGRPILFLQSPTIAQTQLDGAWKLFRREIDRILIDRPVATVIYRNLATTLSYFGRYLLELGAKAAPYFTRIIDLAPSEKELHQHLRKSYPSLINWGKRELILDLLDSAKVRWEHFESFRQLHIRVAGRETRSLKTWELQHEMVRNGEAFVVLGALEKELVTAALYLYSSKYCYYGVSAAARELFEKPLSHAVMWSAIIHAKEIGCRVFETGEQLFPGQGAPTSKQLAISDFKRGFGGNTWIQLDIVWNTTSQVK